MTTIASFSNEDKSNTRSRSPHIAARRFTSIEDLEIIASGTAGDHDGYVGRMGGIVLSEDVNAVVSLEETGSERYLQVEMGTAITGSVDAGLFHNVGYSEPFTNDSADDTIGHWTEGYYESEVEFDWPQVSLSATNRLVVHQFLNDSLAQEASVYVYTSGGSALHWWFRDAAAGNINGGAVPAGASRFRFRVYAKAATTVGGNDGLFKFWISTDDGENWTLVFDRTDALIDAWTYVGAAAMKTRSGGLTTACVRRTYEVGWAMTEGYSEALGETIADRRAISPLIAAVGEAEVWKWCRPLPDGLCLTGDVDASRAALRLQVDSLSLCADWLEVWGNVEYRVVGAGSWTQGPVVDMGTAGETAPGSTIIPIAGTTLTGLLADTEYEWRVTWQDDETTPSNTIEPLDDYPSLRFRTPPAEGALFTRTPRIAATSCTKGCGRHLPTYAFGWLGALASSGAPDSTTPDLLVIQDDINYPDSETWADGAVLAGKLTEGGPAYLVRDYDRINRQWIEDPVKRSALRSMSVRVTYGDHLVANNWSIDWWGSDHALTTDGNGVAFTSTAGQGYRDSTITRGLLVENAMTYYGESFAIMHLDAPVGSYANGSGDGFIVPEWRDVAWGRIHFIQINTRAFMDPSAQASTTGLLGSDQEQWVEAEFGDRPLCPLKVLLSPSPMADFVADGGDNWEGWTANRQAIRESMRDDMASSHEVLIVSGDRHAPQVHTFDRDADYHSVDLGDRVIGSVVACPSYSAFPGQWTSEPTDMDAAAEVLWCLRGSGSAVSANNRTDGLTLTNGEMVSSMTILDFDETAGHVVVTMLDGIDGTVQDDGKGNAGSVTLTATSLASFPTSTIFESPIFRSGVFQ